MSDSYYRAQRTIAQLETTLAESRLRNVQMAKFLYSHKREDLEAAMRACFEVLGVRKPAQLALRKVA